jgi:hypothetical protein
MDAPPDHFVVCVHDVWPVHEREIAAIFEALRPRVGRAVSVAVVPLPLGKPWPRHCGLPALVLNGADEVLLHGLTHQRPRSMSLLSAIIGRHDEFARLHLGETMARLRQGRELLADLIGTPVHGVLPPAWRAGRITAALDDVGLEFVVGMTSVRVSRRRGGRTVPLATRSWDAGPIGPLGHLLDLWGATLAWRKTAAVPSIALHPADVRRSFLPRAMACIDRLLADGRRPTTFRQLLVASSAPPAIG